MVDDEAAISMIISHIRNCPECQMAVIQHGFTAYSKPIHKIQNLRSDK